MIAFNKMDRFGFQPTLENLCSTQFQVLEQNDTIAFIENVSKGVLDDTWTVSGLWHGFTRPFMAAGNALPFVWKFQYVGHLTHGAGRLAHLEP